MSATDTLDWLFAARPSGSDDGAPLSLAPDLAWLRTGIVNVAFLGLPDAGDRGWVLVDTGLPGMADTIAKAAEHRFGPHARPAAIVLTHGHFDHTGAARTLAERWDAPVYAHPLELPYLTGRSAYPPPDPTVGGGVLARLAMLYPSGSINLGNHIHPLPADGVVPGAAAWQWLHTPGHAPGHVSLFRDSDKLLVAGDAFVTTKQESLEAVWTQRREMHGPPMHFTPDWNAARESVRLLAALEPEVAITGHGLPMRGAPLRAGLVALSNAFDVMALPRQGRYRERPAITDENGIVSVPPALTDLLPIAFGLGVGLIVGLLTARAATGDDVVMRSGDADRSVVAKRRHAM